MSTFRGFIAIEITPSPTIQNLLHTIQKNPFNIKLVEPNNIHITLKFLGDTQQEDIPQITNIMTHATKNMQPFTLSLKGCGVFPNFNYIKVIWIGIQPTPELPQLASTLNQELEQLGYPKETRPFSPHLTIGRMRTAKNKDLLKDIIHTHQNTNFGHQPITKITLKQSTLTPTGPIYTTLHNTRL